MPAEHFSPRIKKKVKKAVTLSKKLDNITNKGESQGIIAMTTLSLPYSHTT